MKNNNGGFKSILINIIIPALIMMKGQKWLGLDSQVTLAVALVFPFSYGLYDLLKERKWNFISILGFFSVLLTGGVGLLKLSKELIAYKEAAVPFIIGMVVLLSMRTKTPLVKTLLVNDAIMDIPRIENAIKEQGKELEFKQLINSATYLVVFSFLLSTILNFLLAKVIIQSETGTAAFTEELGKMTAWSYPVIAIPCTLVMMVALWRLVSGIKKLTKLDFEDVLSPAAKAKESSAS